MTTPYLWHSSIFLIFKHPHWWTVQPLDVGTLYSVESRRINIASSPSHHRCRQEKRKEIEDRHCHYLKEWENRRTTAEREANHWVKKHPRNQNETQISIYFLKNSSNFAFNLHVKWYVFKTHQHIELIQTRTQFLEKIWIFRELPNLNSVICITVYLSYSI